MKKWFNSRYYFLFWMLLAFIPMKYVFDVKSELPQGIQEESSRAPSADNGLYSYDENQTELAAVSDDDLLKVLELSEEEWQTPGDSKDPYALSPEQLDNYEKNLMENYGLEAQAEIDFTSISGDEAAVNYENITTCAAGKNSSRGNVERVLDKAAKQNPILAEIMSERSIESQLLPRKCVTHVMNKFNIGKSGLARCPNGAGTTPMRGGAKPCVSKNVVNLTYNNFTDVAECLNIDPKDLLPKLSNESGMLINTLGGGFDAGVGQLTQSAIEEVNKYYDYYLAEIEKAAIKKPSCLRLLLHKSAIKKTGNKKKDSLNFGDSLATRCSFIAPPDNPLRNIVYMAMYNRRNLDYLLGTKYIAGETFIQNNGQLVPITGAPTDSITIGKFADNKIPEKFAQLGMANINYNNLATMIAFAGYNTGPSTAFNMLNEYLTKRVAAKKPLTEKDFDFHNPESATDIDGKTRTVTEIARLFVRSAIIRKKDPEAKSKLRRAKFLPEKIRKSHLLTFPEFLIYNQNNFDSSIVNPTNLAKVNAIKDPQAKARARNKYRFSVIGAPGYLSFLASKDSAIRNAFANSGADKYYCSNPNFLKITNKK